MIEFRMEGFIITFWPYISLTQHLKSFVLMSRLFLSVLRSVSLIDSWAFASSGLLNVTVPSSVTYLGQVVLTVLDDIFFPVF